MKKKILSIILSILVLGTCMLTITACNEITGSTEGVLYELSDDESYAEVIGYEGSAKNVIIAEEYNGKPVKSIYKEAFKSSSINSVVIPYSVTSIGSDAFYDCESLKRVTIGNSVTSIGNDAFSGCKSSLYTIENNLKYVKANNNPYCILVEATNKNLSTYQINSQTKYIASSVFSYCERLTQITIPDSVTSIGSYAFYNCNSLTSVTIPDSVTSIGESAFTSCRSLTKVNYAGTIDDWAQIEFGDEYANPLYYTKNLYINDVLVTEVVLTTATKISSHAFHNCNSLTSITIPDSVTSIGRSAFFSCNSLTSITIPDSVTIIGYGAFYDCDSLTSVTIGNSVTIIGYDAFYDCDSLTSVTIGNSVTSICEGAFWYCDSLTSIKYCGSKDQWNSIVKGSLWDYKTGAYTIIYNYAG